MSNVIGKIKVINETQNVTASFKKRELVITTDEQYPQHILIEFAQDKCDVLNGYKVGDSVDVSINLRGREWINPQGEAKYFNQIQGWRIQKSEGAPKIAQVEEKAQIGFAPADEGNDDLPF